MFYAYLVLGFGIFGAGMFLVPGWYKMLWIVGCLAAVIALPAVLERVLDPLNVSVRGTLLALRV